MSLPRAADLPVGSIVANTHSAWIKFSVASSGGDGGWLITGDEMGTYDWDPQTALDLGAQVLRVGPGPTV